MTTLFSWTGVDSHGPASVYIASDSRISWGSANTWDVGRKLFASKSKPEIFGYCGSVTFPIQILGQLVELIDCGVLFLEDEDFDSKLDKIRVEITRSFRLMPASQQERCRVIYASRVGSRMSSTFHVAVIDMKNSDVTSTSIELPDKSGIIVSTGTGKLSLKTWYEEWVGLPNKDPYQSGRTSRNVFSSFCDSLESKNDLYSGGAPQLVGLYREGPAKNFGIINNNKRFINGVEVDSTYKLNDLEWRNNLFERCCGESMEILKGAQRQPRLREVKRPSKP